MAMPHPAGTETAAADAAAVWHAVRLGRGVDEVAHGRAVVRGFVVAPAGLVGADPHRVADLLIIISELVTNTLDHTLEQPVVVLGRRGRLVHVEVRDGDPGQPQERAAPADDPHGRGMALVARLSDRHGVRALPSGGKAVWAELDV